MTTDQQAQPTTDMGEEDWMDVMESEFVDIATSEIKGDTTFIFEHPEIGLHGFRWESDRGHLKAVSVSESSSTGDER
jgi:hypothetical protein